MRPKNSGPRANNYSRSKFTNWTNFSPQDSERDRAYNKFYRRFEKNIWPEVFQMPLHKDFIAPVTKNDIEQTMARLPREFLVDLRAVILLGGSNAQAMTWRNFSYGVYGSRIIYIHPFSKSKMVMKYKSLPRPDILREYKRVGAMVKREKNFFRIEFTKRALNRFYLRDVFIHEVGHHVDRCNFGKKRTCREEPFAEWFATEYGFNKYARQRRDSP